MFRPPCEFHVLKGPGETRCQESSGADYVGRCPDSLDMHGQGTIIGSGCDAAHQPREEAFRAVINLRSTDARYRNTIDMEVWIGVGVCRETELVIKYVLWVSSWTSSDWTDASLVHIECADPRDDSTRVETTAQSLHEAVLLSPVSFHVHLQNSHAWNSHEVRPTSWPVIIMS